MRKPLLRIAIALFTIVLVGNFLALLIGRFIPAQMLTTTLQGVTLTGNRYAATLESFVLVDLNRHIRLDVPFPIDAAIERTVIRWNGQETLIQTSPPDGQLYYYHLITGEFRELNWTYTYPETETTFQLQNIYNWSIASDDIWDYNPEDGAVYRLDVANNTLEHIVTLPFASPTSSSRSLTLSPSGTQLALVTDNTIYIFNADGSDMRRYLNPVRAGFSYGYWLGEEQYFYVTAGSSSADDLVPFRIFDLNSDEINPTTQELQGASFAPCWTDDVWLLYLDAEAQAQLLNYETGETRTLGLPSALVGQSIENISWLGNCEWIVFEIRIQPYNSGIGLEHQPIYVMSRDGQTVHFLGEQVGILTWLNDNRFLLAEAHGDEDLVYEVRLDSTLSKTLVGHFAYSPERWMSSLISDPYRFLSYDGYQMNDVQLLDVRTGRVETYFAPNELIRYFPIQWLWA